MVRTPRRRNRQLQGGPLLGVGAQGSRVGPEARGIPDVLLVDGRALRGGARVDRGGAGPGWPHVRASASEGAWGGEPAGDATRRPRPGEGGGGGGPEAQRGGGNRE